MGLKHTIVIDLDIYVFYQEQKLLTANGLRVFLFLCIYVLGTNCMQLKVCVCVCVFCFFLSYGDRMVKTKMNSCLEVGVSNHEHGTGR